MKRFAVILIIAVLAIGCVFAATGDSKKTDDNAVNSGDKFIVTTTVAKIYPVYKIAGSNTINNVESNDATSASKIEGLVSEDGNKLTIYVAVKHFGKADNNMDTAYGLVDIRYFGKVTVTVTGYQLKNTNENVVAITTANAASTDNHVYMSDLPTAGEDLKAVSGVNNFTATASKSGNVITVEASYDNGKKVATGSDAVTIADGSFVWDISELTAGDSYAADVVVTYTSEN